MAEDFRRYAAVRCTCGRTKDVLVESLTSGRTQSCGQGACKAYSRVERDPDFVPRPPRACSPETVAKAWERYHHPDPVQRRNIEQLARIHKLNKQTLATLFRSVRRVGSIKAYLKAVT